jgi:hypothetical protein
LIAGVAHGVRLVRHVDHGLAVLLRVLEGRADDPLDALAGVDVLVDGHLVGRAPLELTPHADVDALGVLAEHHEIHVLRRPPLERHQPVGQRFHRPDVGVEIEALAHPEDDVAGMLEARHPRVAERAEQHRRALPLDRHPDLRREGRPVAQIPVGPEVEIPQVEGQAPLFLEKLEQQPTLANHLGTDAISPEQRDFLGHGAGP